MKQRTFNTVAGTVFLLVAVLHALRLLRGWDLLIAGRHVPLWASWAGLALAGFLAYSAFSRKGKGEVGHGPR